MSAKTLRHAQEIADALASGPQKAARSPKAMILGRTDSGHPVAAPTRNAPNTNNVDAFRRVRAQYAGWSKADHMDASVILENAAVVAREAGDSKAWRALHGWAGVHWDIGGRWVTGELDARHPVILASWAGEIRR